jgi:signal peptidase I
MASSESGAMESAPGEDQPAKPGKKETRGGTTRFLVTLFIAAAFLRIFIFAPFVIPSGSMLPRMMIGDYLFVSKWSYGYSRYAIPFGLASFEGRYFASTPQRGDVVIFRYPGRDEDWVKRLIGLPGDTIEMRGGRLILNGKLVPKQRIADFTAPFSPNSPCRRLFQTSPAPASEGCTYPRYRETLPGGRSYEILDQGSGPADETERFVVPAGHYFVMGDNRDDSADSRFTVAEKGVGLLPADNLLGEAQLTFFSTDGSAEWLKPWTWFSAARWERIGGTY